MAQPVHKPKAVTVLIDNSSCSINADFFPNRLEAQKTATERYAQYLVSVNPESRIATCTLSNTEFGIRSSFTNSREKLVTSMNMISSSGSLLDLLRGIKCAILALRSCNTPLMEKRILTFVGTDDIYFNKEEMRSISDTLLKENIYLDIFVIGKSVKNIAILESIIPEPMRPDCVFMVVERSNTVLSDDVLSSPIGPMQAKYPISEISVSYPALAAALQAPRNHRSSVDIILKPPDDPDIAKTKSKAKSNRKRKTK